jgi:hypothetical protein
VVMVPRGVAVKLGLWCNGGVVVQLVLWCSWCCAAVVW